MMTTNDYLNLLDRSVRIAYNPLAKTIEFMDKVIPFLTVDKEVHEVSEEFNQALNKMVCQNPSDKLYFIEASQVCICLERLLVQERQRKFRLLITK